MKHIIALTPKKETPGTFLFAEGEKSGKPPVVKTAYVKKYAAQRGTSRSAVFSKSKDTPGTVKYAEAKTPGTAPMMGTLYVQKWAATAENITVELKFAEDGSGATMTITEAK